jgi:hypothetical protein
MEARRAGNGPPSRDIQVSATAIKKAYVAKLIGTVQRLGNGAPRSLGFSPDDRPVR